MEFLPLLGHFSLKLQQLTSLLNWYIRNKFSSMIIILAVLLTKLLELVSQTYAYLRNS